MIVGEFIRWYYVQSPKDMFVIWQNFLRFSVNFFGVRYHVATFFRPWHLIVADLSGPGGVNQFFSRFAAKAVGSGVGMVMRSLLIVSGLVSLTIVFVLGIAIQILWLILPFGLLLMFFQGMAFLVL